MSDDGTRRWPPSKKSPAFHAGFARVANRGFARVAIGASRVHPPRLRVPGQDTNGIRDMFEPMRRLGLQMSTYLADVWPRQVKLARAFGWGPSQVEFMDLVDLRKYIELAEDYPDALLRMRAFNWTSIDPNHVSPDSLRMWLAGVLSPPDAAVDGDPAAIVADPYQELADRASAALASDGRLWIRVGERGRAGRPNLEALALSLGLTGENDRHRFRPDRPVGRLLEPMLDELWRRCFRTVRPQ
jgi:hypothetical protein